MASRPYYSQCLSLDSVASKSVWPHSVRPREHPVKEYNALDGPFAQVLGTSIKESILVFISRNTHRYNTKVAFRGMVALLLRYSRPSGNSSLLLGGLRSLAHITDSSAMVTTVALSLDELSFLIIRP